MSDPFIGEIKIWSFDWAPYGWALCQGQLLSIQQNTALFSLLGTQFGGNGTTTFGLPDLRGRVPLGTQSPGYQQGESYMNGTENVTLTSAQVSHNHSLQAIVEAGDKPAPTANFYAKVTAVSPATTPVNIYGAPTSATPLDPSILSSVGGNQSHNNMQPFLVLNYCIATMGIYPIRP